MTESALARPPSRKAIRLRRFTTELFFALWMPVRLFLRHWPVLFTLAVAGVVAREGLIRAAVWLAGVNNYLGFFVFLAGSLAVIVSLVLMLLAVRSSLPSLRDRTRSTSMWADLGNVLIPFVAFYMAFGLVQEDFRRYDQGLSGRYESLWVIVAGTDRNDVRVDALDDAGANVLTLLAVVAVAFALRWALDRWELSRRIPLLGILAAFLEVVWVVLGLLFVVNQAHKHVQGWAGERVAWHAVLDWWHGLAGMTGPLGGLFHTVDDWLVTTLPSGDFDRIFVVPITGLVSAAVVYNLTVSDTLRPPVISGRLRWLRYATGGVVHAIRKRFGPLIQGARAMGRSGVVPIMFFCLCVVALQTALQWLTKAELVLLGPREHESVVAGLDEFIKGVNDVVLSIGLVCVLAAAVDGVARRNLRRAGQSAAVQPAEPARSEPDVIG